jgi:hypothetical protein
MLQSVTNRTVGEIQKENINLYFKNKGNEERLMSGLDTQMREESKHTVLSGE